MDSSKKLEILLTAKDKASKQLEGFGNKISGVAKKAAKLTAAFVAVGAAAATAFGKKAVDAAIDLGESINAVEKTFGDASDRILEFGKTADKQAGLSRAAFNKAVVPIGAMLQNMGIEAENAADESINLGKRAADLASVFNTDLETALTAIQAGLRGEADPLEKFGVGLKQTAVKAYALEEGIISVGEEMDETSRATAALGLFMKQTDKFAGDFVDTSDQAANRQRILEARIENLSASIGDKLLPVWEKILAAGEWLASNVLPNVSRWIENVKGKFQEWQPRLQDVASQIADIAKKVGEFLLPPLERLWSNIKDNLIPELTKLWQEVLGPLAKVAGVVLVVAVGAAIQIVNALVTAVNHVSKALRFAVDIFNDVVNGVKRVIKIIADLIKKFGQIASAVVEALSGIVGKITGPFKTAFSIINGGINVVIAGFRRLKNEAGIASFAATSATTAAQAMQNAVSGVTGARAHGGGVQSGRGYLVGERGPEYFVPNQPGRIVKGMDAQRVSNTDMTVTIGNVTITSPQAADQFFANLNRDNKFTSMGLTGAR